LTCKIKKRPTAGTTISGALKKKIKILSSKAKVFAMKGIKLTIGSYSNEAKNLRTGSL
jgi:hypothetical protein